MKEINFEGVALVLFLKCISTWTSWTHRDQAVRIQTRIHIWLIGRSGKQSSIIITRRYVLPGCLVISFMHLLPWQQMKPLLKYKEILLYHSLHITFWKALPPPRLTKCLIKVTQRSRERSKALSQQWLETVRSDFLYNDILLSAQAENQQTWAVIMVKMC